MEIGHFKISGHSTKRNWAVYIFVATPKNKSKKNILYVGKVGDNRAGCNPVISRVGNHFSHNKIHSQIRNAIPDTGNYDYEYFYCHFDEYNTKRDLWENGREKTNELERELNRIVQRNMDNATHELLNPYGGKSVSKADEKHRTKLLSEEEKAMLGKLCAKAL